MARDRDNPIPRLTRAPFEELFQFSSDRSSSELGEPSEEPSQMSKEAVNTPRTDTAVGPSDQRQANERVQGTIESFQDTRPDSTSESLRSFSPSTEIKNGSLSNPIIDYSKSARPSAYHEQSDHQGELSQQSQRHIKNRSPLYDVDGFAQSQLSLDWGLDLQDCFIQDDNYSAQLPCRGCEGESPLFIDRDLQISGSSEAAFYDFDSFIDSSPRTTP
ncbi:hypothetical protein BKA61DRAFT_581525 [Leptodontidium sp. MPI-SDFR-AT-0119]|nr:hypothetical protein BKA61DRAFT_581525 [Leptodontidium sp. MPI-SDFR-AT-0119]